MSLPKAFAREFRKERMRLGLMQKEAAAKIGISKGSVSDREVRGFSNITVLQYYCEGIGIDTHQLIINALTRQS